MSLGAAGGDTLARRGIERQSWWTAVDDVGADPVAVFPPFGLQR